MFKLGAVVAELKADVSNFKRGIETAKRSTSGLESTIKKVGVAIGTVFAAKKVFDFTKNAVVLAGKFESVSDSYRSMVKGMEIDGEKLIKNVKKATSGTVSEMDVMMKFLKSATLIGKEALGEGGKNFERFATIAKKSARVTGQDVEFMFESIVNGIGRTSAKWLDNTGIVINATDAYEEYAKSIGGATKTVTLSAKKEAELTEKLGKHQSALAIATQKKSEFTDKTKESTKMINADSIGTRENNIAKIKASLANKSWSEAISFTGKELTEEQKKIALTNAYLSKAEKLYEDVAVSAGGVSSSIARMAVATEEMSIAWGNLWIPIAQPIVESLTRLIGKIQWLVERINEVTRGQKTWSQQLRDMGVPLNQIIEKVEGFIAVLERNAKTIEKVAKILIFVFLPAIIKLGIQSAIAGTKMLLHLIFNIVKLGIKSFVTATVGMAKLIWSVIKFALEGWKAVAMIAMKIIKLGLATGAFILHTAVTIAQTAAQIALTAATWLFNLALAVLTSPIWLVIAAIAALIAIGYLLIKNWDKVKAFGKRMLDQLAIWWGGFVETLKKIGNKILSAIMWPFDEAKRKIEEAVNWIKDKLDFTKRHSPSVVDILERGVREANRALEGLNLNTLVTPQLAAQTIAGGSPRTQVNRISVNMRGAIIASEADAEEMGEKIGDSIIKKLQMNVRV